MGAQLREFRRRIRATQSTKKITRAMELIAASRIVRAQHRIQASRPYAEAITETVRTIVARSGGDADHPLLSTPENPTRAALLLITSDRGLAGGYNVNVLRRGEQVTAQLRERGVETVPFLVGRKAVSYYRFRGRDTSRSWTGFSEQPQFDDAKAVGDALLEAYHTDASEGGLDEIHLVYTRFESLGSQRAVQVKLLPMDVSEVEESAESDEGGLKAEIIFEPEGEGVLDALLPRYLNARIYAAMLDAASSEQAARQRAMKSATDNADELIKSLTRDANAARQAEITQEIMEIVGGAEALSGTGNEA